MGRRDESESSGSQEDYSYDYSSYDYSGSDSKSGGANPERKGGKDVGSKDGSYSYSYSGSEDYDGSYSYSGTYSYSGSNTSAKVPSTAVPAATATGGLTPTVSAAVPTGHSFDASTNSSKRKEASGKDSKTGSSYYSGYSNYSSQDRYYSYDEEDTSERTGDSYSYSYSESATKDDSKPQNDPQEKPSDSYSYSYSNSYYSYDESSEKETYSRTRGSSLEDDSYSYGYSSTISKRRSTGKAEAEGSSETTGDYEYSYTPYSADTTDGSRYYSGSTNRTSYSYSYSTDSAVPEQRSLHEAAEKLPSTEDSYYSKTRSTTSGGVRDTGSSYTASDSNSYYYSYSESSSSALTSQQETAKGVKTVTEDVAVDDLSRSTTSSYQYTDEKHSSRSSSTDDMTEVQREVVILATPSRDIPQPPAPPKRCFVVPQSTEDALYAAVAQVMAMQKSYNERFNPPKSAMFSTEEIVMKQKRGKAPAAKSSTPDAVAPDGMFSKRFTRVLLGVLEMPHHERQAALAGAATPTSFGTLLNTFILSATTQVKEHMAHAFLAQDPYRSGELPLSVVANVLHGMGVAESPTIEGVRINVALTSDRTAGEIAMSVETLKEGGVGEVEGCGSSIEHIYMTEIVRRGIEEKTPIAIRWKDSNITAGPYVICRNIKEEHNYQRLKTFIEAATYICVLVNVFSIVDADGSVLVLYPHLVRSVLLMESPTGDGRRPIYLDNLFRHVYSPDRYLAAYSQGKTLPLYHRKAAMESVMQTTCDGDDKRSIVAIPAMSHDRHKFSKPAPPPPENLCIEVQLSKVRVPAAVPANSRCFCLISLAGANAGPSGLLPAVEVPVAQIRSSKKESGSFTWTFVDRTHPESRSTLLCVGGPDEHVWIEYCFEVPVEQNEGEVALPTSNNNRNSASTVVYSAGYSHMALSDAQGGTIDVHEGCLFDALGKNESPTNGTEGPAGSKAQQPEERERKPKKGLFGCVSSLLPKPSLKAKTATCARLNVTTAKKSSIALSEGLPDRFIVLKRHAPILGELRASIVDLGKQCSHTVQAMRHQFVKRALHVAADAVLLDQLDRLWKYRKAHPTKRAGGSPSPTETLLYSASMIFALHTISESEKHTFADLLTKKGKHVKSPFDEEARQPPVFY